MKTIDRIAAFLLVVLLFAAIVPASTVYATEEPPGSTETTATTASTTAAPKITLSKLYVLGSNNKIYEYYQGTSNPDKFYFTVPDWMEEVTIMLKPSGSATVSSESAAFENSSGMYSAKVKVPNGSNSFGIKLKTEDAERNITVIVSLDDIKCKLESVSVVKGTEVLEKFSSPESVEYTFASGTTSGVSIRLVPRHEQTVEITNLTGIPADQITGSEPKTQLTLHSEYKRYDYELPLVEGTNVFLITVTAGTYKVECRTVIIVGDPNANAVVTTQSTESTAPPTEPTSAPTTQQTAATTAAPAAPSGGTASTFPPVLWVTVGIVIAVVVGACIFMIVNMGNRNNNGNGGGSYNRGGYDDGYDYDRAPRYPARRNLADYVDDDYDYGYGAQLSRGQRGRRDDGYYNNRNSYNNYTDGYNPDYPEQGYDAGYESNFDDGYGSGTPRGGSSRLGGFENDDDYGSGNYYGGY